LSLQSSSAGWHAGPSGLPRLLALLVIAVAACSPEIGDKCQISTDCSIRGDRLCDISQPGGYCTQLNCRANSCADDAACILFYSAVPGCTFDDRSGTFGSRVARSFCMKWCESNADCRDGYVCADARTYPWNAVILDDNQAKRTCLAAPLEGQDAGVIASVAPPAVCGPAAPPVAAIDAGAALIHDAGVSAPPLFPIDAGAEAAAPDGG
jgi:hypothetical protein